MTELKKVILFFNRNKYDGFSEIIKVDSEVSNVDIVKSLVKISSESFDDIYFNETSFFNSSDGFVTDFKVESLKIIDLTIKE